jgi:hypothetical protein
VQGRPRRLDRRRDEASLEGDVAQTEPAPDHRDVRAAVRTLDESERLLVLLRYWADLTQPEVARLTKLPEGTWWRRGAWRAGIERRNRCACRCGEEPMRGGFRSGGSADGGVFALRCMSLLHRRRYHRR